MADFIILDNKKYKVADLDDSSWKPAWKRQKKYSVGLTGKTIMEDFTRPDGVGGERLPRDWSLLLRVFIATPYPDTTWGTFADLLASSNKLAVTYMEHDGTTTQTVGILKPIIPRPRVGGNLLGECYGVFFIPVQLVKVYS
jgi:hypothetical protein